MNHLFADKKFISQVSSQLRNFHWKSSNTANCSCPYCGDSKKNNRKARGYFFVHKQHFMFKCHNCGISVNIGNFLKDNFPTTYNEYLLELFKKTDNVEEEVSFDLSKPVFANTQTLNQLICVMDLPEGHIAKQYVLNRKIPLEYHCKLFHTDDFADYVHSVVPNDYPYLHHDPRLVIPFYDEQGVIFMIQGRSYEKDGLRYITVKFDKTKPKMYGLERWDSNKPTFVVEGPFDSLFLPNCLAVGGSDLYNETTKNATFIMDNEPRNIEIVKKIHRLITKKCNICLFPEHYKEIGKDINDLVLAGFSQEQLLDIIHSNTYRGLAAELFFQKWKKVDLTSERSVV